MSFAYFNEGTVK